MPFSPTQQEAIRRFRLPFNMAIRCIAHGSLITTIPSKTPRLNSELIFAFNRGNPLRLNASLPTPIFLTFGQRCVVEPTVRAGEGRYHVRPLEYWYQFTLEDDREILTFHWTPFATGNQRRYPHLHIGPALLNTNSPILPGSFHKRHIPTGQLTIGEITRFAIEELEVQPVIENWRDVLDVSIQAETDQ